MIIHWFHWFFPKVSLLSFMVLHSKKNKIPVSHIAPSLSLALSHLCSNLETIEKAEASAAYETFASHFQPPTSPHFTSPHIMVAA